MQKFSLSSYLSKKNITFKNKIQINYSKFFNILSIRLKKRSFNLIKFIKKNYIRIYKVSVNFINFTKFELSLFTFFHWNLYTKLKKDKEILALSKKREKELYVENLAGLRKYNPNKSISNINIYKSTPRIKKRTLSKWEKKEIKKLKKRKKKNKARLFKLKQIRRKNYLRRKSETPLLNTLKSKNKFQKIKHKFFRYCRVFFKFTGSNIYGTITNSLGEVKYIYSGGSFINLRRRKEKITIFVAQNIGELIACRLQKSNAREIFFFPCLNHRKARILLRYFGRGLKFIKSFRFSKVILRRKVMRNGVRLRKVARK